jgi:tetratricopeptide (TPR) repeat protein
MMRSMALPLLLALGAAASTPASDGTAGFARDLDRAIRSYDLEAATTVLSEVREARVSDRAEALAELHVEASLAVAELLRLEYEEVDEGERDRRRILGQRIDATAEDGLEALGGLPESSESQRMRADLIATMIRSDFRAKKFEPEFTAAVSRALELDDRNARAWVSAAKPRLFAPPERGRDVGEAIRHLDRALELDPDLEPALLLRAYAHEQAGDEAAAQRDWRAALEANPDSLPALRRLRSDG